MFPDDPNTYSDEQITKLLAQMSDERRAIREKQIELGKLRDKRLNEEHARKLLAQHGPDAIRRAAELAQTLEVAEPVVFDTAAHKPGR